MSEDNFDMSWIQKHERILDIQNNYKREMMNDIPIYFIYINSQSTIDKIICEKELVTNGLVTKNRILQIVQQRKCISNNFTVKYNLDSILHYNVNIEPEHIQKYVHSENYTEMSKDFLKVFHVIDDIVIQPSIFIFHPINSIYFLFREESSKDTKRATKSILKINVGGNLGGNDGTDLVKHKKTKKVRIVENKTKKHYS